MYNNVLSRYTSNRGGIAAKVKVSTLHSWVGGWWRRITGKYTVPTIAGDKFSFDWDEIQKEVIKRTMNKSGIDLCHWGHLIIDEGQDFPERMYLALKLIMDINNGGAKTGPAITVLADENQCLNPGKNSTLDQIRRSLGLHSSNKNVFLLNKNYRNTLEIAKFASCFYVGLSTGKPSLPTKKGILPIISIANHGTEGKNLNAFVEKIARYASNNVSLEIGVLVPNNKMRKSIINRLNKHLQGKKTIVQTYASDDSALNASDLVFDKPGYITVLNFKSAKGLEFDSVFVIEPSRLISRGESELNARMNLYVMCSRAREFLNVMMMKDDSCKTVFNWLPPRNNLYHVEEL